MRKGNITRRGFLGVGLAGLAAVAVNGCMPIATYEAGKHVQRNRDRQANAKTLSEQYFPTRTNKSPDPRMNFRECDDKDENGNIEISELGNDAGNVIDNRNIGIYIDLGAYSERERVSYEFRDKNGKSFDRYNALPGKACIVRKDSLLPGEYVVIARAESGAADVRKFRVIE